MNRQYLFTSESVSEGHPDKLADLLSDTVLDFCLSLDSNAKVACEALVTSDLVVIAGEFGFSDERHFDKLKESASDLARQCIRDVGYDGSFPGIDPEKCGITLKLNSQSQDIRQGVDRGDGIVGAGDQGLMFGYATIETEAFIPTPIWLSHALMARQAHLRRSGIIPWLRPDAKSQVTVRYEGRNPIGVATVVISTQHAEDVSNKAIAQVVADEIIDPIIPKRLRTSDFRVLVNPTGRFETGGPMGDTGLTGRKIIVDTYGGSCPHGGGAFSGKDPSKVDRSASYMARYVAKNIIAARLARSCIVQLSYAIGMADPISVMVDTQGTGFVDDGLLEQVVRELFDLTPAGIIAALDLKRPIYRRTASYGHFGRELPEFRWEMTDRVDDLRNRCGLSAQQGSYPPQDQRRLSRFMHELNSGDGLSSEMQAWWIERY